MRGVQREKKERGTERDSFKKGVWEALSVANVVNADPGARWGINFDVPRFLTAMKIHDCEAGAGWQGSTGSQLLLSTESRPGKSRVDLT